MKRMLMVVGIMLLFLLVLSGCMPGDGSYIDGDYANFLSGIWHGWIAPISLIRGLFDSNIRIYEVNNTGLWYDFGFYIAVISGFGGLSLFRRKREKD